MFERARRLTARTLGAIRRRLPGDTTPSEASPRPAPAQSGASAGDVVPARAGPQFNGPFWRVGRILLGHDAMPASAGEMRWDVPMIRAVTREASRAKALSTFARTLSRGGSLEHAHAVATRALLANGDRTYARALAEGVTSSTAHHLGLGLVLHSRPLPDLAWAQFSQLDETTLARLGPVEAVESALMVGTAASVATAVRIGQRGTQLETRHVIDLSGRFLISGHLELARALVDEADRRPADELDAVAEGDDYRARDILDNVRRWTHPTDQPDVAPEGAIDFAVFDYHLPDLSQASRNVGDYVQSLALLGNLARFQEARFTGAGGLGETATSLQRRVRPEMRLDSGGAIHLRRVSRDYSEGDDLPENTWMVAFGWHLHTLFGLRYGLPYHRNLNPLFVSFHLNPVKALTPEAIEYLKTHGPIGCRDWTTVDLLLSAGVDAFFTGCLTTTVDAVFPPLGEVKRQQPGIVAVIDTPADTVTAYRPIELMTNSDRRYREVDLVDGIRLADEILHDYQRRVHRIVTSRLHSYLPATSLGIPVKFRPRKVGDVRFDGLLDMSPGAPAFAAMRDGIRALLASTLGLVFDHTPKDQVYAHWRQVTAALVAEARTRHETPLPPEPESIGLDIHTLITELRGQTTVHGPHDKVEVSTTDVAVALDQNLKPYLPTMLESLISNASGPVRLWVLARGLDPRYRHWLSEAWPEVPMTFFGFDGVDYGDMARTVPHITVATMDRLLLPELLADVERVTYVDIDTITEGDVCELAAVELGGHPLAARTSEFSVTAEFRRISTMLPADKASDLRRTMAARHAFDFTNFNAGVLVLDLARMRADGFVVEYLPLVARFGLNDQDILNTYAGPHRVELDRKWNALPMFEDITEPGIVHYAGALKPWSEELTPYRDRWEKYADQLAARVGSPPP